MVLYLLALKIGNLDKTLSLDIYKDKITSIQKLPKLINETLSFDNKIQIISKNI